MLTPPSVVSATGSATSSAPACQKHNHLSTDLSTGLTDTAELPREPARKSRRHQNEDSQATTPPIVTPPAKPVAARLRGREINTRLGGSSASPNVSHGPVSKKRNHPGDDLSTMPVNTGESTSEPPAKCRRQVRDPPASLPAKSPSKTYSKKHGVSNLKSRPNKHSVASR